MTVLDSRALADLMEAAVTGLPVPASLFKPYKYRDPAQLTPERRAELDEAQEHADREWSRDVTRVSHGWTVTYEPLSPG